MLYKLKKIGWNYKNGQLYVYRGNNRINKEIKSNDNNKIFQFIHALDEPRTKVSLRNSLNNLSNDEFNSIFNFFLNKKWIYKLDENISQKEIRLSNFIDSFPNLTYPEYKRRIKNINILILGLGTGGSYVMEMLTKLGFKHFILIDGDKVEKKNLLAQNYNENDIGKHKVDVIKNRYSNINGIDIKGYNKFIKSYKDLSTIINLKQVNYIVNCADNFKLGIDIISNVFKDIPDIKILYGGYTFLIESNYFLTKNNYKQIMNSAIKESKKFNGSYYLMSNMGSIFNGISSANAISNFIFYDLLFHNNKDEFIADFLKNTYQFSKF